MAQRTPYIKANLTSMLLTSTHCGVSEEFQTWPQMPSHGKLHAYVSLPTSMGSPSYVSLPQLRTSDKLLYQFHRHPQNESWIMTQPSTKMPILHLPNLQGRQIFERQWRRTNMDKTLDMHANFTFITGLLTLSQSQSPSFHRFLVAYQMICSRTRRTFDRKTLLLLENLQTCCRS